MSAEIREAMVSLKLAAPVTVGDLQTRVNARVEFNRSSVVIQCLDGEDQHAPPCVMFAVEQDGIYLLAWNAQPGSGLQAAPDHCIKLAESQVD